MKEIKYQQKYVHQLVEAIRGTGSFCCAPLRLFRHEASHKAIGDGGTYPYLGEHITGILVLKFEEDDVDVIEHRYQGVDGKDGPKVPLGVALPVFACIEEGERAKQ